MSREFFVPCQPYAYPIRSRLSSSGGILKSLVRWRAGRTAGVAHTMASRGTNDAPSSTSSEHPFGFAAFVDENASLSEAAGSDLTNETNTSYIESQENKSDVPRNPIENNLVSSSFDPGTSSYTTADSVTSFHAGELENEDSDSTTTLTPEMMNSTAIGSALSNLTTESRDDDSNPINDVEMPVIPAATLIGVQLPTTSGSRILDILYVQSNDLNSPSNARSTTTEESFTSAGSEDTENSSSTTSGDNSGNGITGVIEIVTTSPGDSLVMFGRRPEPDYARPYYDLSCGSGASEGVVSGVVSGMDCMPLRPGPFHYLISEQAKSLVALQELQNEVGALLEFRDLVIETFPNLRHKMAVTAAASAATGASSAGNGNASVLSQGSHIPLPLSSQSPSSRRIGEWEPGKVRRRVAQSRENESSSSSLPRSRSNSHSGGNKHSATVQDSGFSTETSSKDSASTAIPRPQSPGGRPALDEADNEDELWNLLDVIHRKGVRLREEVESLQGRLESVAPEELDVPSDILDAVRNVTRRRHSTDLDEQDEPQHRLHHHSHDGGLDSRDDDLLLGETGPQMALLQREKLQLLDKVAELEAETISSRARAQELQAELATLSALRSGLENRLRAGLEAGDGAILAPGAQRLQPIEPSAPTSGNHLLQSPRASGAALSRSKDSAFASVVSGTVNSKAHKNRFRTRTIEKNVLVNVAAVSRSIEDVRSAAASSSASVNERRARLGALDSVLISPTRIPPGQVRGADVDERKIAAILRERSPLELQRHLITTTVHNQVLQKRLDEVEKSSETLSERLGKAHEENEDLRFQLAERNIELEGTRARVRVLERLQQRPATENDADDESEPVGALHNGHQHNGQDVSSSSSADTSRDAISAPAQSSQPATHLHNGSDSQLKPSPRRRPSRIPLLGATKAAAPKPPTTAGHRRTDSRDSLKSLSAPGRAASIPAAGRPAKTGRESSRESLNKSSLPKGQTSGARESVSRSLSRSAGARDSLGRQSAGPASQRQQQTRDSLEAAGGQPPGTPPRRPPAPARRSQSQAGRPSSASVAEAAASADSGKSMLSENPPSSWLSSGVSYYPDSLNSLPTNTGSHNHNSSQAADDEDDETSSRTASTRVEFIIGSPTRKRFFRTPWALPRYFDSIDTEGIMQESFESDEYSLRRGEGLAECDSLECDDRLDSES